jgi:glycosyltransferase involved in cell wall biosynthesis
MARQSSKIFAICGPYWYDTIDGTAFSRWKDRMVRLDMAVDTNHFPFLRQETGPMAFNPPDQRRLVYIGGGSPHKNLSYLTAIMSKMPDVKLHWYGGPKDHPLSRLSNVTSTPWGELSGGVVEKMVADHDIMVNVSVSDANPTTLLETRAWGLITACTQESGYYNDEFFTELYLEDIDKTIAAIRGLLTAPTHELYQRAVASRAEVVSKYTWQKFCDTVWKHLSPYIR